MRVRIDSCVAVSGSLGEIIASRIEITLSCSSLMLVIILKGFMHGRSSSRKLMNSPWRMLHSFWYERPMSMIHTLAPSLMYIARSSLV